MIKNIDNMNIKNVRFVNCNHVHQVFASSIFIAPLPLASPHLPASTSLPTIHAQATCLLSVLHVVIAHNCSYPPSQHLPSSLSIARTWCRRGTRLLMSKRNMITNVMSVNGSVVNGQRGTISLFLLYKRLLFVSFS